jgi:hypothetical protein
MRLQLTDFKLKIMTRETSIAAYHAVEDSGLVSRMRLVVLKILAEHGPLTANELRQHGDPKINSGIYTTRFSELRRMGLIYEVEQRPCAITGVTAISWDLTGETVAKKLTKKSSFKEKKEEIIRDTIKFGDSLPMTYRQDLRDIYHKLKDL